MDAYEISQPRADYASEKLGVNLMNPSQARAGSYDCFFSAHVIEHVPSVRRMFELGFRLLRPGGLFVAFAPNGSDAFRRVNPTVWHKYWGLVHPQLIDETFVACLASANSYLVAACPYSLEEIRTWSCKERRLCPLEGNELLLAIRKDAEPPAPS